MNKKKELPGMGANIVNKYVVLIGDLFVEFDSFTEVLLFSFPQQVHIYPAIAQALPHLVQLQTPTNSPPPSPNSSGSLILHTSHFFTILHSTNKPTNSRHQLNKKT